MKRSLLLLTVLPVLLSACSETPQVASIPTQDIHATIEDYSIDKNRRIYVVTIKEHEYIFAEGVGSGYTPVFIHAESCPCKRQ